MNDPTLQTDGALGCALIVAFTILGLLIGIAIGMIL